MLLTLTKLALARSHFTLLLMLLLCVGGSLAFVKLPIDAFPDVSAPQVKLILKRAGMTPEEMETRVTSVVEMDLIGIPGERLLRSTTKYGLSDITIDFVEGTDIYWARNQVAERLASVWDRLPSGISGGLAPVTTPLGEMYMFTVEGPQSLAERRSLLDWTIRPALRGVPGVADVNALGGRVSAFEVVPNFASMSINGVSLDELRRSLMEFNQNDGGGRINEGSSVLLLRTEGRLQSLDDIARLPVKPGQQDWLRVGDVAEVRIGALNQLGGVTHDGEGETVQGLVLGMRGANAAEVVHGVKARLAELSQQLPAGVRIVPFYDRSELVARAVHTVGKALLEATILVIVLLVIFLGSLRAAIIVALVLPLSALWTFLLMTFAGLSANLMSLGGLAIAIGMLVDAAVVIVENIMEKSTHLSGNPDLATPSMRKAMIYEAIGEVALPISAGILIIGVVFLPLLTLQGLEGKLFGPVALTIIFALVGSLLLSLTCIPWIAYHLLRHQSHEEPWFGRLLHAAYRPLLGLALGHPLLLSALCVVMVIVVASWYPAIGKSFMPTMDEGSIIVQLEKPAAISLQESLRLDTAFQKLVLQRIPEVERVVARAGSDEIGLDPMGFNQTDTFLSLRDAKLWRGSKDDIQSELRILLDDFPGLAYTFTQPIEMRVSEMILGVRGDLAVRVFGPDLVQLNALADAIAGVLRDVAGVDEVFLTASAGAQYLRLRPKVQALARQGLTINSLSDLIRIQVEGEAVGQLILEGRPYPLLLRASGAKLPPEDLLNTLLYLPNGERVRIAELADIERVDGPVVINRESASRNQVVIANIGDRDLVGFVAEARAKIAERVPLPEGYRLTWGGEFENQQRAAARLALVVPAALFLVMFLLYSVFGSLTQAIIILCNIPFALIGGIASLAFTGEFLSVPASVGFIALLGIAVLNGIVLLSCFSQLQEAGLSLKEAVSRGAMRRLKPVLLTATLTSGGLVPMLFATGPGSEIERPLAVVVLGGLVTSTLLTLFLLPVIYVHFGPRGSAHRQERHELIHAA